MKEFIVRKGVFLKTNNDLKKISDILLCLLSGFVLFKLLHTSLLSLLGLIYCFLCSILCIYVLYILWHKKQSLMDIVKETSFLYSAFLTYIFVDGNNYLVMTLMIMLISILKVIRQRFKCFIVNPYLMGLIVPYIFDKVYILASLDVFIYSFMVLLFLLIRDYIKRYLVMTPIICLIIMKIITGGFISIFDIFISSNIVLFLIYIIADSKTTPLKWESQIIYGLVMGILCCFFINSNYLILGCIIISLIYSLYIYIEGKM